MTNINDSAYGKNLWVIVGSKNINNNDVGKIFTSNDPSFNIKNEPMLPLFNGVAPHKINRIESANNKFLVLNSFDDNTGNNWVSISYSLDGINWNISNNTINNERLNDVKFGTNNWVAIGFDTINNNSVIYTTNNATILNNWNKQLAANFDTGIPQDEFNNLLYSQTNNVFYAFGNNGLFFQSNDDGINWIEKAFPIPGNYNTFNIKGSSYDEVNDILIICGDNGQDGLYAARINGVWDNAPTVEPNIKFNSVVFTGVHFYIAGEKGALIIANTNNTGAPLNYTVDPTNTMDNINNLSYAKNTLLISLETGIASKIDAGDREMTLGGNFSIDNNFSTIGCNVVIEAISNHSHNDNEKKVTLHGDLEISNKNIAFNSNDNGNKVNINSDTTIDQNLSQTSTVSFENVLLGTSASGGGGQVASKNYVDTLTNFQALYDANGGTTAVTVGDQVTALLAALGINPAASNNSSGNSVNGSKIANSVVKIQKISTASNEPDNNNFLYFDGGSGGEIQNDPEKSEIAITDTNGEFTIPEAVISEISNHRTTWHKQSYFVRCIPITQHKLNNRTTYARTFVNQPSFDSNSGVIVDEEKRTVLAEDLNAAKPISINTATNLIASYFELDPDTTNTTTAVTDAAGLVETQFGLTKNEITNFNPYKTIEEPDGGDDATKKANVEKANKILEKFDAIQTLEKAYEIAAVSVDDTTQKEYVKKAIREKLKDKGQVAFFAGATTDLKEDVIEAPKEAKITGTDIFDNTNKNLAKNFVGNLLAAKKSLKNNLTTTNVTTTTETVKDEDKKRSQAKKVISEMKPENINLDDFDQPVAFDTSTKTIDTVVTTQGDVNTDPVVLVEEIKKNIEEEADNIVEQEYVSEPIEWTEEDVAQVGNTFTITVKVNKQVGVEFSLEENVSNITFSISQIRDTYTLVATPDAGLHIIVIKAKENNIEIRKKIEFGQVVNDAAEPIFTHTPMDETEANNLIQEPDDDIDIIKYELGKDDDNQEIEIEDPDGNTNEEDFVFEQDTVDRKKFKLKGKPKKFGNYKIRFKIRRGVRSIKRLIKIFIRERTYEQTIKLPDFFGTLAPNETYTFEYSYGNEILEINVDSGIGNTQKQLVKNIVENIRTNKIFDYYLNPLNVRVFYISSTKIEFRGNRIVKNIEAKKPGFEFEGTINVISAVKNQNTIVAKLKLPAAFANANQLSFTSSSANITLLDADYTVGTKNGNIFTGIGNLVYVQVNSNNNLQNVTITANYINGSDEREAETLPFNINVINSNFNIHINETDKKVYIFSGISDANVFQFKFDKNITVNTPHIDFNITSGATTSKALIGYGKNGNAKLNQGWQEMFTISDENVSIDNNGGFNLLTNGDNNETNVTLTTSEFKQL